MQRLNLPFRDAHHVTGRLVALAEAKDCDLEALPLGAMQKVEPRITKAIYSVLGVDNSVKSRTSFGGTAPGMVRASIKIWRQRLARTRRP